MKKKKKKPSQAIFIKTVEILTGTIIAGSIKSSGIIGATSQFVSK